MKVRYDLHLEQSQKLVMTPQLKQAIQILQFTSMELENFIEQELEVNPVLEVESREDNKYSDADNEDKYKNVDWKEYVRNEENNYSNTGQNHNEDNDFSFECITSNETTLQEHLLFQYHLTLLDYKYKEIGEYIINSLDENGYLSLSIEEISKDLNKDISIVENILKIIQTFDPPGIAARSLKECLLLQLIALDIKDDNIYVIVENYLQEVGAKKYPYIAKQLGLKVQEVQEICDFIKTLEPKPGRKFSSINNNYVVPDVVVKKIGDEYIVQVNDSKVPRLIIREDYKGLILNDSENEEAAKFLSDKLNSAMWLIRSIEQRRQTIYKVVNTIVKKQRAFFEKGKKHLRPMTLKEVADEVNVHESTVSRATTGKYVETPIGVFELKYFFSSGVEGFSSGEEFAAESIKNYIREIIDSEDSLKPMSDDKIASQLAIKGINISRRTVAKYRDDLNIPPSSKRRRY
ncbi:RNA polymerase factor sigma-54 [Serpentinicella alkaliphila]|uniref:RNA polymerase RpoN-/SigL-like sigma 54 subunit n=1 Tax=Serpentinicella alkaliphila TaxID=1734049 RepID=A0A4R2TIJ1_9FIRM|nr:RNA polymerase factor sigma-54 [Serpentinicella alkaliphila]QUH25993.1 RNA polymerase factor sigma-54 [Serpentinicella alkaliphila]TCQ02147.1 RNA polymerase RpoN-/SigL-like sigma 54 subunit [Serpentinicella alkaliphila]